MTTVYVVLSFVSFVGAVLLVVVFWRDFAKLARLQKIAIVLTSAACVAPPVLGTIVGFIQNAA